MESTGPVFTPGGRTRIAGPRSFRFPTSSLLGGSSGGTGRGLVVLLLCLFCGLGPVASLGYEQHGARDVAQHGHCDESKCRSSGVMVLHLEDADGGNGTGNGWEYEYSYPYSFSYSYPSDDEHHQQVAKAYSSLNATSQTLTSRFGCYAPVGTPLLCAPSYTGQPVPSEPTIDLLVKNALGDQVTTTLVYYTCCRTKTRGGETNTNTNDNDDDEIDIDIDIGAENGAENEKEQSKDESTKHEPLVAERHCTDPLFVRPVVGEKIDVDVDNGDNQTQTLVPSDPSPDASGFGKHAASAMPCPFPDRPHPRLLVKGSHTLFYPATYVCCDSRLGPIPRGEHRDRPPLQEGLATSVDGSVLVSRFGSGDTNSSSNSGDEYDGDYNGDYGYNDDYNDDDDDDYANYNNDDYEKSLFGACDESRCISKDHTRRRYDCFGSSEPLAIANMRCSDGFVGIRTEGVGNLQTYPVFRDGSPNPLFHYTCCPPETLKELASNRNIDGETTNTEMLVLPTRPKRHCSEPIVLSQRVNATGQTTNWELNGIDLYGLSPSSGKDDVGRAIQPLENEEAELYKSLLRCDLPIVEPVLKYPRYLNSYHDMETDQKQLSYVCCDEALPEDSKNIRNEDTITSNSNSRNDEETVLDRAACVSVCTDHDVYQCAILNAYGYLTPMVCQHPDFSKYAAFSHPKLVFTIGAVHELDPSNNFYNSMDGVSVFDCCREPPEDSSLAGPFVKDDSFLWTVWPQIAVSGLGLGLSLLSIASLALPILRKIKMEHDGDDVSEYNGYNFYLILLWIPDALLNSFVLSLYGGYANQFYSERHAGQIVFFHTHVTIGNAFRQNIPLHRAIYYACSTANLYLNCFVAHEVYVLLKRSRAGIRVPPPSLRRATLQALVAYSYGTAIFVLHYFLDGRIVIDDTSIHTVSAVLYYLLSAGFPLLYLGWVTVTIWRKKLVPSGLLSSLASRHGRGLRELAMYYFRIIVVFLLYWAPGVAFLVASRFTRNIDLNDWIQLGDTQYATSPWLYTAGLLLLTLQPIASVGMALTKTDVRRSFLALVTCGACGCVCGRKRKRQSSGSAGTV